MPVYEYRCTLGHATFINRAIKEEEKIPTCPMCNEQTKRVFGSPATQFIGSGFYSTDKKQ
jgi:putative FmdB family regulatory protein